jgi:hypothetical protein
VDDEDEDEEDDEDGVDERFGEDGEGEDVSDVRGERSERLSGVGKSGVGKSGVGWSGVGVSGIGVREEAEEIMSDGFTECSVISSGDEPGDGVKLINSFGRIGFGLSREDRRGGGWGYVGNLLALGKDVMTPRGGLQYVVADQGL